MVDQNLTVHFCVYKSINFTRYPAPHIRNIAVLPAERCWLGSIDGPSTADSVHCVLFYPGVLSLHWPSVWDHFHPKK